jgi:antitoxin component YwqK of YwqJK toxin-antitoxin module
MEWFKDGQKRLETTVKHGQFDGQLTVWNKDGTINDKDTGVYVDGKKSN